METSLFWLEDNKKMSNWSKRPVLFFGIFVCMAESRGRNCDANHLCAKKLKKKFDKVAKIKMHFALKPLKRKSTHFLDKTRPGANPI